MAKCEAVPVEVTITQKKRGVVPEEFHFHLHDGRKLKSILELIDAFDDMSDETFKHHVNEHRNDFANWVCDVMKEDKLAKDLRSVNSKLEAQNKLLKHLLSETKGSNFD